ncbi:MAG TPA: zinc ribbon domain-containing protein [Ktedonobacteraceae bacterium]
MDSSNTPWTEQEKMKQQKKTNQPAEEDEIVDLSGTEEQIDDPTLITGQMIEPPIRERPIEPPPVREQPIEPPVRSPVTRRPADEEQRFTGVTCPQCGNLLPANATFCSRCGAPLAAFKSQRPVPQNKAPSPGKGTPAKRPKKGRMSRGKLLWIGLAGIVGISVLFGIFSQSSGNGAVNTTGTNTSPTSSTTQPSPAPATPRTTPTTASNNTAGALVLLNPGVVRQGVSMGVTGTGFKPRATIDVLIKQRKSDPGQPISLVHADKYGNFYDNLTVPQTLSSGPFFIEARERGGNKVAQAAGVVAGGAPQLKLSEQVGKPGDMITVSVHGFSPSETIKVYWNTMIGQPFTTLQADSGGGIGQAAVQVPFGATGVNTFLFVGSKSLSMVAAPFDLLSLYPTIKLSSYALRADHQLNFSGSGFGPGERVLVYLNNTMGQPMAVIQTTQNGRFANATGFVIPFNLRGRQTLIFLGEESRASVAVGWSVLPYMPNAQASTYGGLPGTTISFYASGFARQEVVHVYVGHAQNNSGNMVSCFRTDDRGNAVAAGSYVIPGDAQGKITFQLVGAKSRGVATANMSIMAPPSPVQVPAQPAFTCPLDNSH